MTGGELHETSRLIGRLEQAVRSSEETIRSMAQQWAQQEQSATDGRHKLHQKIDDLRSQIDRLTGRMTGVEDKMTKMAPIVRAGEIAHLRSAGVRSLLRILWLSLIGLGGMLAQALTNLFPHR